MLQLFADSNSASKPKFNLDAKAERYSSRREIAKTVSLPTAIGYRRLSRADRGIHVPYEIKIACIRLLRIERDSGQPALPDQGIHVPYEIKNCLYNVVFDN
jgi:hypothetical protein